jgi:hypothetical protein
MRIIEQPMKLISSMRMHQISLRSFWRLESEFPSNKRKCFIRMKNGEWIVDA